MKEKVEKVLAAATAYVLIRENKNPFIPEMNVTHEYEELKRAVVEYLDQVAEEKS